jgi:hypothetical protein
MMQAITIRACALVALLGSALGSARGDVIDQSYLPTTGQGFNVSASVNLPLGQEFTPTLSSLNFVDMFIGDAGSDVGPGASFRVLIHSSTITGTVLGTSNTVGVADNTNLGVGNYANFIVTRFTFASSVFLTPGQLAVIEVQQQGTIVPGNSNFLAYGGPLNSSTYAGGRGIVNGAAQANFDFAFREGVLTAVPEPTSIVLCGLGLAGVGLVGWRRRVATA